MKPETRSFYGAAVQRAIDHIAANLDTALDLRTVADLACLSPFHFHRVFRGMTGETPLELRRRLCLERAAWRLARNGQPVTDVAFDAGYETHEAFTRAFRAAYGTPPSGFKHRKHPRIELAATCGVHYDAGGQVPAFIPRDSGGKAMDVEIKNMRTLRVGTVHHVGPYNQIPQAFERLSQIAGSAGLFDQPGAMMVALYHDDPESTPVDQLQSDAGIVIPEKLELPAGLDEQTIPAGRYASTEHVGPYEQLPDVWARLMGEWLPASGHRIAPGPSFEVYRNTPLTAPKDQLITELYVPIQ
jgi:AraC family transcriptional regulator